MLTRWRVVLGDEDGQHLMWPSEKEKGRESIMAIGHHLHVMVQQQQQAWRPAYKE